MPILLLSITCREVNTTNQNVVTAFVILLVAFAALGGVAVAVQQVKLAPDAPDYIVLLYNGLIYVFTSSSVAPLFVMVRNIYGYLINKYTPGNEPIQYEGKRLLQTWLTYEGYMKGTSIFIVAATTGTPYEPFAYYISGAASFVIDLVRSSLKDIADSRRAPAG